MPDLWRICRLLPSLLLLPLCCRDGVRADMLLPESSGFLLEMDTTFILLPLPSISTSQFQMTSLPIPETTPTVTPATSSSEFQRTSTSIPGGTPAVTPAASSSEFQRTSSSIPGGTPAVTPAASSSEFQRTSSSIPGGTPSVTPAASSSEFQVVNVPTSTLPTLLPIMHTSSLPQSFSSRTSTPTPLTQTSPASTVSLSTSTVEIVPSPIPSSAVGALSSDLQMSSSPQLPNNLAVTSSAAATLPLTTVVVTSSIVATETIQVSSPPPAMPVSLSSSVPGVLPESSTLIRSTSVPGVLPESSTLIRSTSVAGILSESSTLIRSTSVPGVLPESSTLIRSTSVAGILSESSTLIRSTSVPGVFPESSTLIRSTSVAGILSESSTLIRSTSVPGILPESSTPVRSTSVAEILPESSIPVRSTSVAEILPESSTLIRSTSAPGILPVSSTLIRSTSVFSQPQQSSISLQTSTPSSESTSQLPSSSVRLPTTTNLQPTTSQPASAVPVASELPTATPSPSGGIITLPTTGITTSSTTPPSVLLPFSNEFLIGIATGGGVIALLLLIILILCCCCVCSTIKKRRKRRQRYHLPRTYANPQAIYSNGRAPHKYHHQGDGSLDAYDLQYINVDEEPLTAHKNFYHEMAIESELEDHFGFQGEASQLQQQQSQVQHSQMSEMADLFQEHTLPKLSPLSYSSQLQLTGPAYTQSVFHHMEPERGPPALSSDSPYLGMTRFPNSSPSLRLPTRMALSLQNEESKSMQGSKASLPGSKSSHQGSKASILGSRSSVQGSRSQQLHSGPPRDELLQRASSMLEEQRENLEEDSLSLQWSGRTASPMLDESQVPTRDSPVGPPLATSQPLGYGKKDFASLTCIPNHPAMEMEELTLQEEANMEELLREQSLHEVGKPLHSPETSTGSSVPSPRRRSTGGRVSLGEMTTLPGQEEAPKPSNDRDVPTPTQPSPSASEQNAEEETGQKKSSPAIKKSRSRAMSRLEKLTSLDYIRASLRLKKKRVSFQKSPESTPKSKKRSSKKKVEQELVFTNRALLEGEVGDDLPTPPQSPTTKTPQQPKIHPSSPPRYPPTGDFFSPEDEFDFQGGPYLPPVGRQRAYTDIPNPQAYPAQLSQPTYYPQMAPYQQDPAITYAQLSQQYYPPPPDTYYPQHYQLQPNPYGRRYSHDTPSRYPGMVRQDSYSHITSPDHERHRAVTTPERYLEAGSRLDAGYLRARSPDRFTDTSSSTSDRYHTRSPDRFTDSSHMSDRYTDGFGFMSDRYLPDRYHDLNLRSPERYVDPHRYSGATSPSRFSDVRTPDTLVGSFDDRHSDVGMPDRFLDSMERDRHYRMRPPDRVVSGFEHRRDSNSKQTRKHSDASNSDKSASRSKVSWDSEIIEYPRPPSDMSESDIDLNL